jgi:hypothetical protein
VGNVKKTREAHPTKTIIAGDQLPPSFRVCDSVLTIHRRTARTARAAGNVVTGEMVEELLLSGADIIKIGIGPGSVCTTRKQTGVGYPQLSAILECADAAHGLGGHVISDGGCTCPGDFSKAGNRARLRFFCLYSNVYGLSVTLGFRGGRGLRDGRR